MTVARGGLFFAVLGLSGCGDLGGPSPLWGTLEAGDFGVGFRSQVYHDTRRASLDGMGRGVELHIWYPTQEQNAPRLTLRDYARRELASGSSEESIRSWLASAVSGSTTGVPDETLAIILGSPMQARVAVGAAPGAFPLVMWTVRHETTTAQSVLSEYLASHGYVVALSRYASPRLPYPWEMETDAEKLHTFQTHADDLSFALQTMVGDPGVDPSRIGVLTWSYAFELASLLQRRHDNVEVVIGLSSNPLPASGLYQGSDAASSLIPADLTASYVVLTERIGTDGTARLPPPIMEQLPSESFFVRFRDLSHGNFNVLEGMIPGVFGLPQVQPWSRGGDVARVGYETIVRYVLDFLDRSIGATSLTSPHAGRWDQEQLDGPVETTRFSR